MGLFGLGKKKELPKLFAPVDGEFTDLANVSDPVFAQKMMGEGFAVIPHSNEIFTPIEATVVSVFKTKHAVALKTVDGLEVLLHLGLDTVELNGEPFEILVKEGDELSAGSKIGTADFEKIKAAEKDPTVLTVITNTADKVETINFSAANSQSINHNDVVGEITVK